MARHSLREYRSHAFLQAVGPMKALFVEHGLPADFDEVLAGTVAALEEAGASTHNGRQSQMSGTAGMRLAARRGVRAVRVLASIVAPTTRPFPFRGEGGLARSDTRRAMAAGNRCECTGRMPREVIGG